MSPSLREVLDHRVQWDELFYGSSRWLVITVMCPSSLLNVSRIQQVDLFPRSRGYTTRVPGELESISAIVGSAIASFDLSYQLKRNGFVYLSSQ